MCAGAILLYKIPRVVIGENKTFKGEEDLLRSRGVEVVVLDNNKCRALMKKFVEEKPEVSTEATIVYVDGYVSYATGRNGMKILERRCTPAVVYVDRYPLCVVGSNGMKRTSLRISTIREHLCERSQVIYLI